MLSLSLRGFDGLIGLGAFWYFITFVPVLAFLIVAILIYFTDDEESDAIVVSAIALINTESTTLVESTTGVSTEEELHAVNNVATATTKINFFIFYF
jgi:hypothetical protein